MVKPIRRSDLLEEIADALALGDLGLESAGYVIHRTPDESLLVDYQEADVLFLVSVSEISRDAAASHDA